MQKKFLSTSTSKPKTLNFFGGIQSDNIAVFLVVHAGQLIRLMRFSQSLHPGRIWQLGYRTVISLLVSGGFLAPVLNPQPAQAQATAYCQMSVEQVAQTDKVRQSAFKGNQEAQEQYQALIAEHAAQLKKCRNQTWPQTQAIWLRLYPCDIQPGVLEAVLDRIVARGYNQVYVEFFYDGQVLIPESENRTVWPSAVRVPGSENIDLFAKSIEKGRERGLQVYAWMFTLNFGYTYAQLPNRQQALARKGNGQTTNSVGNGDTEPDIKVAEGDVSKVFIDPYSPQARRDYLDVINAGLKRRPDGMLFDYVRYPRGTGPASVVSKVEDLWIYGAAAQQLLMQRALNKQGQELIKRYVSKGFISSGDVEEVNRQYPNEAEPLWQGRKPNPGASKSLASASQLQTELWYLSVAHAVQGIVDFLTLAVQPVQRQGIPAGAVFFPGGNKTVGQGGFDSRLQPWDRFPSSIEWHPMAYGNCGNNNNQCILDEVQRVLSMAPKGTKVIPALAGNWGEPITNRPPLESQMQAIRRAFPQINGVSHFAYSWQEPEADRARKFCKGG